MEYLKSANTLKTVKMLVLSNIFRPTHKQIGGIDVSIPTKYKDDRTYNSLRIKQRTRLQENIKSAHEFEDVKIKAEKRLSCSVDAIANTKSKVICGAKGLLETNLDDLFSDSWSDSNTKELGASEPVLSFKNGAKSESYMSVDSDGTGTDSDGLDEVVREQRKCMGARRIGHLLRRVISRNGKFQVVYLCVI